MCISLPQQAASVSYHSSHQLSAILFSTAFSLDRERPLHFVGFSLSPLTCRNIVSIGKKLTCNSHLQKTARHGGTKCGLTGMSRGQMLI